MENWFDREQVYCLNCGHRWILISNKNITKEQHDIWIKAVFLHHQKIQEERNGTNNAGYN